ncbi:hypothetical protein UF75_2648 [Desulfosporosinus sp. I2]|uniref:beta-propeller domain-containing protein n=1 Tax=Desulfosporosinus sp. I2 TaxID=1617025 RepID=UPI00061E6CC3|nr:beta-propeller domain-containing protein [Desulfosporosinus sp. I2]KJR46956.1 hypothetical protein UF75_2648 [Desulfosporosinus sp. I2]
MKRMGYFLALLSVCTVVITIATMNKPPLQSLAQDQSLFQNQSLPVIGTVEKLRSILETAESSRTYVGQHKGIATGAIIRDETTQSTALPSSASAPATSNLTLGGGADFSKTNLQVDGVDEADIVKNDGKYIYQVNKQELIIAQAVPSDSMSIVSRINFSQGDFLPRELYVDDKYLVLIGDAYCQDSLPNNTPMEQSKALIYPPITEKSTAKVIIYDLADRSNLKIIREVELDGIYVSSRKIGSNLYLIANKYLDTYRIMKQGLEPILPRYRDTVGKDEFVNIDYPNIRYFPNFVEPNYLLIAGLNLDQNDQKLQVSTYLGSGQTIYASTSNFYIAVNQTERIDQTFPQTFKTTTELYRFSLDEGRTEFKAKGNVPGTILNQFAMDEHKGHFRIATTNGETWKSDSNTSQNNVYILDQALQLTGKLENIAPGEKIYSVRFMGDRGYMVTFKNVDPFFVLDLKVPDSPKILGALKIPGFSDYLHPYDENHVIGFGKETIELSQINGPSILPGEPMGTNAFYQGLKLAVFDVTDVNNPVEMFKTTIGDRGTDSEVLRNHKALLFDKEKGLLSFPVTLMEIKKTCC